jgi:hypothetical protein
MAEEHITHLPDGAEQPEFERQDLSPRAVFAFLIGLAIAGALISVILFGAYKFLNGYEARNQPEQNPMSNKGTNVDTRKITPEDVNRFPQPRLETNERTEINSFRWKEEQTLSTYGWVDQKAGVVHIPIDRAMEMIVERGLPTRPQAGTVPPSTVNTTRQAAAKSDQSQKTQAKPPNR